MVKSYRWLIWMEWMLLLSWVPALLFGNMPTNRFEAMGAGGTVFEIVGRCSCGILWTCLPFGIAGIVCRQRISDGHLRSATVVASVMNAISGLVPYAFMFLFLVRLFHGEISV